MPKRKQHVRIPNGWGSVRYLGKGRRLPYAVHPPATERNELGFYIRPKAICYVPDWYTGFGVLSAYHAGTYTPGLELQIAREVAQSSADLDAFCRRVLKDRGMVEQIEPDGVLLKEVYEQFMDWKFGENAPKALSYSAKNVYRQGYKYLSVYADNEMSTLTVDQLQKIVNDCDKKKATRENIVLTAKQLWKYALSRDLCEKDIARHLVIPDGRDDEHGIPFSDAELALMWKKKDVYPISVALIMCYSGFRIGAFSTMKIDLQNKYFKGGLKTAAGKDRIVPIHSAILPLVENAPRPIVTRDAAKQQGFRNNLYEELGKLGITGHTPHDCRHTFSRLCEAYGVHEADRKRMMGHSFGGDITNSIYGHRTLEELRSEIEKIGLPQT